MPFIVVIGASAGGQEAVCKLIASLPGHLNAALFIVMHISRHGLDNFLVNRLQKCTTLHCQSAAEAQAIEPGHIYIAPADHHLIVTAGFMHLRKALLRTGGAPPLMCCSVLPQFIIRNEQ